jgi:hypothetical protein
MYSHFFSLWLEVYERHLGQAPVVNTLPSLSSDAQSGFGVPRLSSVWNNPDSQSSSYRPPSPDKLQNMLGTSAESLAAAYRWRLDRCEGKYTTMPLEERLCIALSRTQESRRATADHESDSASIVSDISQDVPLPPSKPPITSASWNSEHSSLSKDSGLQMKDSLDVHYNNIWDDKPTPQADALFEPPPYAPIPEWIQSHYEDVMSRAPAPPPSSSSVENYNGNMHNVFPWQKAPSAARPPPSRVFPAMQEDQLRHAAPSSSPPSSLSSPKSYLVNAWDSIEGINKYANNLRESVLGD